MAVFVNDLLFTPTLGHYRRRHDVGAAGQTYRERMELVLIIALLIVLGLAANRWGVDSRRPGWTLR
jgi:hypothetical protein